MKSVNVQLIKIHRQDLNLDFDAHRLEIGIEIYYKSLQKVCISAFIHRNKRKNNSHHYSPYIFFPFGILTFSYAICINNIKSGIKCQCFFLDECKGEGGYERKKRKLQQWHGRRAVPLMMCLALNSVEMRNKRNIQLLSINELALIKGKNTSASTREKKVRMKMVHELGMSISDI